MAYTKDIGLRDFYKFYVDNSVRKGKEYVDYKTYAAVIKDANLLLRDKIVYEAETVKLPYKLGTLSVHKFAVEYTEENQKSWRINYKATKEAGHVIYYGSPFGYKWKWNKRTCRINGKRWYQFKACRTASRLIADAVNNKQLDYYTK